MPSTKIFQKVVSVMTSKFYTMEKFSLMISWQQKGCLRSFQVVLLVVTSESKLNTFADHVSSLPL